MGTFLKRYLKHILLAIVFIATIVGTGIANLQDIVGVEKKKSSYTRTQFDYFISSPNSKQVQEIEAASAVDRVFPYYALSNAFTQNSATKEIFLLLSDDMDDAEISLITEETRTSGAFEKSGLMLDGVAAEKLGVKVGDAVSFTILGKTFTRTVSALYLSSTYGTLTKGIALTDFSEDIRAAYRPAAYGAAFLTAKDKEGVKTLLQDYVGEGNVALSFEEYVYTVVGNKPPYMSQEEYDISCQSRYAAYREEILAAALRGGMQVAAKEDSYRLLQDQIETTENGIRRMTTLVAIATAVLMTLVGAIFVVTNRRDDCLRRDGGRRFAGMVGGYALTILLTVLLTAGISFLVLYLYAAQTFFLDLLLKTVVCFALPVAAAIPALLAFVLVYAWRLYANKA